MSAMASPGWWRIPFAKDDTNAGIKSYQNNTTYEIPYLYQINHDITTWQQGFCCTAQRDWYDT
jgi:hypothetical protein